MPQLIDFTGVQVDLKLRCGSTAGQTWTDIYEADETTLITNITAARVTFREGTPLDTVAGTVILALTATVTGGATIAWSMTPAQTRLFAPGDDYWYQIEFDTADGGTWSLVKGSVASELEGVT